MKRCLAALLVVVACHGKENEVGAPPSQLHPVITTSRAPERVKTEPEEAIALCDRSASPLKITDVTFSPGEIVHVEFVVTDSSDQILKADTQLYGVDSDGFPVMNDLRSTMFAPGETRVVQEFAVHPDIASKLSRFAAYVTTHDDSRPTVGVFDLRDDAAKVIAQEGGESLVGAKFTIVNHQPFAIRMPLAISIADADGRPIERITNPWKLEIPENCAREYMIMTQMHNDVAASARRVTAAPAY